MGKSSPYNYKHVYACNISQFCPVGFRLIDNAMIHSCVRTCYCWMCSIRVYRSLSGSTQYDLVTIII